MHLPQSFTENHPCVAGLAAKELGLAVSPDGSPEIETAIVPCQVLPTRGMALMLAANELPGVIRGVSGIAWRKNGVIGGGCCCTAWPPDPPQATCANEIKRTKVVEAIVLAERSNALKLSLFVEFLRYERRGSIVRSIAPPPRR